MVTPFLNLAFSCFGFSPPTNAPITILGHLFPHFNATSTHYKDNSLVGHIIKIFVPTSLVILTSDYINFENNGTK